MNRSDLEAIGDILGRLMSELEGVTDEESNFPGFQPTCQEDLRVKSWQADLQPGDYFMGYYPGMDLVLYGEMLVDKERRRERRQFQRYVRVYSDAAPDGEYGVFHVSNLVVRLSQRQFKLFERNRWHPATRDEATELFYDLHDNSTPESIAQEAWGIFLDERKGRSSAQPRIFEG